MLEFVEDIRNNKILIFRYGGVIATLKKKINYYDLKFNLKRVEPNELRQIADKLDELNKIT